MLARSAQPRKTISSPAKGSTGQNPLLAMIAAIPNETKQMLEKNSRAARTLSEQ